MYLFFLGTLEQRQPRSSALQQRQSRETTEDLIDPANNSKNGVEEKKEIQTEIQTAIKPSHQTHDERITNFRLKTLSRDVKYAGKILFLRIICYSSH